MTGNEKVSEGITLFLEGVNEVISDFVKRVGDALGKVLAERNYDRLNLRIAVANGLMPYRCLWLSEHGSGRVRKKQYSRARRELRKSGQYEGRSPVTRGGRQN